MNKQQNAELKSTIVEFAKYAVRAGSSAHYDSDLVFNEKMEKLLQIKQKLHEMIDSITEHHDTDVFFTLWPSIWPPANENERKGA
jgi:hypothetical protein